MKLPIALSFCPNDTFLFYAWIFKKIDSFIEIEPSFFDIESLNNKAKKEEFSLIKCSCFTYCFLSNFQHLKTGAAFGSQQGPKLITKKPFHLNEIHKKSIALPGEWTTAHFLFSDHFPQAKNKVFTTYDQMFSRQEDACVIIHESRFTFEQMGYFELADLGVLYAKKYQTPAPLGVIVASKSLENLLIDEITRAIQSSYDYAKKHPKEVMGFVNELSIEKDETINQKHIDLYVNEETRALSSFGENAINQMKSRIHEMYSFCSSK